MIELERRLALGIIVPVSLELVILADNDLIPVSISTCLRSTPPQPVICIVPTSWLAPGNFTVASCFSLYRWKAGAREGMMSGVSAVRALISVFQRKCFSRPSLTRYSKAEVVRQVGECQVRGSPYRTGKGTVYRPRHRRAAKEISISHYDKGDKYVHKSYAGIPRLAGHPR